MCIRDRADYVWLDRFTIQNLELLSSAKETGRSFIEVLDHSITPMGSRMMNKWVILPLVDVHSINKRLDVVEYYCQQSDQIENLDSLLRQFGDLERLINKAAMDRLTPREAVQLKRALAVLNPFKLSTSN